MASSGTKKGKTKWKPVDPAQIINPNAPRKLTTSSWADETNDLEDTSYDYGRKTNVPVTLPTAPRAARGAEIDANIPKEPPFQAYLSNLSYEATEEDLADFFMELKVKSVRLPRDDRGSNTRARGFGYVEFEDRNSLIEALSMPETTCKGRRMRIELAENGDQGRGGRGGARDRNPNEPDRTMGDWRSGPRTEAEAPADRDGYRSGPRRDYGSDRGGGMYDRDRRGGGFRDDDRDRSFRSREGDRPGYGDNRGGGGSFRDDRGGGFREERSGGFRENVRDDRGFRDDRGGGYERRGFEDRRDDRRGGGDYGDRGGAAGGGGGGGGGTWRRDPEPRPERDAAPTPERSSEPKTRQRLNLQPRSKPVEEPVAPSSEVPAVSSAPTAASIFGGARPVDTAAREREIEERLAKQKEDRPPQVAREESKVSESHSPSGTEDDANSATSLEPAPPPKENVWARRSQQTNPAQVNNGRASPHEEGETKNRDLSPSNEPRKYQPPKRNTPEEKKREDRGPTKGGGPVGKGGGTRITDSKPSTPLKPREQKKDSVDETIKMPKVQEHAPNFVGSNKYAYLEDSENVVD